MQKRRLAQLLFEYAGCTDPRPPALDGVLRLQKRASLRCVARWYKGDARKLSAAAIAQQCAKPDSFGGHQFVPSGQHAAPHLTVAHEHHVLPRTLVALYTWDPAGRCLSCITDRLWGHLVDYPPAVGELTPERLGNVRGGGPRRVTPRAVTSEAARAQESTQLQRTHPRAQRPCTLHIISTTLQLPTSCSLHLQT